MGLPSVERQRRRLLLLRPRLAVAPGDRLKFGSHLSGELGDFVVKRFAFTPEFLYFLELVVQVYLLDKFERFMTCSLISRSHSPS
jgi:hypothetical protein